MSEENSRVDLFGDVEEILLGLSWDMISKDRSVDLDASCVFYDMYGRVQNAVFYNQLETRYAVHSGDNKSGEGEGFDETIRVKLRMLGQITSFMLVINCHSGGDFSKVKTAKATVLNAENSEIISEVSMDCTGNHTALIFCIFYFDEFGGGWKGRNIRRFAKGRNFQDIEVEMKEELRFLVPEELENEMMYDNTKKKSFNMKKGDTIRLKGIETVQMGLGWNTKCDLDSSVICVRIDENFRTGEIISYSCLQNRNKSIIHHGDNVTGEGAGDDEKITVSLGNIPGEVGMLALIVNVFTGGKTFGNVRGAYCRLLSVTEDDGKKKKKKKMKQICRYNLSKRKQGQAMIMCTLKRNGMNRLDWIFRAVGEEIFGKTAKSSLFSVQKYIKESGGMELVRSRCIREFQAMERRMKDSEIVIERCPTQIKLNDALKIDCYAIKVDKMDLFV